MGWASGSKLMDKVIDSLNEHEVDEFTRSLIYRDLIPAFQDMDWDTEDECLDKDPAFDETMKEFIDLDKWWGEEDGEV